MAIDASSIPPDPSEMVRAFFASEKLAIWADDEELCHKFYEAHDLLWNRMVAAPINDREDAAAKLTLVLSWIDDGNAERTDGSDRKMLRDVLAFLRSH